MKKNRYLDTGIFLTILTTVFVIFACDPEEKPFSGMALFEWNMVEPGNAEAVCGNGSPFRFFVNPSDTSKNVVIYFQAGGACWDYPSCSGQEGIRGAANPEGIPEDFMKAGEIAPVMSPFIWRDHPYDDFKTRNWTMIFIPYCTGDVFTGDKVVTYTDPEGIEPDLVFHHAGHETVMSVLEWMTQGDYKDNFQHIPTLLVTGSSAGGVGAFLNYYFIREALGERVGQGILLNDSGPVYPAEDKPEYPEDLSLLDGDAPHTAKNYDHSVPNQRKVMSAWNTDTVLDLIVEGLQDEPDLLTLYNERDIGDTLNRLISTKYKNDRIAHTQFSMDENFSSYIYERFYPNDIHMDTDGLDVLIDYWQEDQKALLDLYDELNLSNGNTGYFIPYYRPFNESHTVCTVSSLGTLIDRSITGEYINVSVKDFVRDLLNPDVPMSQLRYVEHPSRLEIHGPIPTLIRHMFDQLSAYMDAIEEKEEM